MLCVLEVLLITMYGLDCAGAVIVRVAVPPAFHRIIACRAWFDARVVVLKVVSLSALSVVVPATAVSSSEVIESLTVSPQVPYSSPSTGRANPKSVVADVVISNPYGYVAIVLKNNGFG
jgi:hypothetical protein